MADRDVTSLPNRSAPGWATVNDSTTHPAPGQNNQPGPTVTTPPTRSLTNNPISSSPPPAPSPSNIITLNPNRPPVTVNPAPASTVHPTDDVAGRSQPKPPSPRTLAEAEGLMKAALSQMGYGPLANPGSTSLPATTTTLLNTTNSFPQPPANSISTTAPTHPTQLVFASSHPRNAAGFSAYAAFRPNMTVTLPPNATPANPPTTTIVPTRVSPVTNTTTSMDPAARTATGSPPRTNTADTVAAPTPPESADDIAVRAARAVQTASQGMQSTWDQISVLMESVTELSTINANLRHELANKQTDLNVRSAQIARIRQATEQHVRQLGEANQRQITALGAQSQREKEAMQKELAAVRARVDLEKASLKSELEKATQALKVPPEHILGLEARVKSADETAASLKENLRKRTAMMTKLEDEKRTELARIEEEKRKAVNEAEIRSKNAEATINRLRQLQTTLVTERESFRGAAETSKSEIETAKTELATVKKASEEKTHTLLDRIAQLENELGISKIAAEAKEKEYEQGLAEAIKEVEDNARKQHETLRSSLAVARAEKASIEKQFTAANESLLIQRKTHTDRVHRMEDEIRDLDKKIDTLRGVSREARRSSSVSIASPFLKSITIPAKASVSPRHIESTPVPIESTPSPHNFTAPRTIVTGPSPKQMTPANEDQASGSGISSVDHKQNRTDQEVVVDLSQSPALTSNKRPAEEPLFLSTEDEEGSTPVTVKRPRIDLASPSPRPIPSISQSHPIAPLHPASLRPLVSTNGTPASPTVDKETVIWARNNIKACFLSRAGGKYMCKMCFVVAARLARRDPNKPKPLLETQNPLPGQPTQDELVTHMMTHPDILKAWRAKKEKL
ncbi:hypothetical protein M231_00814 [Tremella mesenterica]|uniref:Uncharacterized protein n=1 Tax=Tremella mesenterica TaxID=5217 RepID=A0A4Q1BUP8_TREME|nr:hypothetical protein M231_00814 [Tremella mesenterica]